MRERAAATGGFQPIDLLCFSHLRWNFVYQRPQHLLSRAGRSMRVIFWEEPLYLDEPGPSLHLVETGTGVLVAQPILPWGTEPGEITAIQRGLLDDFVREHCIVDPLLWYYSPVALDFTAHLPSSLVVYDCMDELSGFDGADPALPARERDLLARADLVFTGGVSLYEAKRHLHRAVHAFPSGVDLDHFRPARGALPEPADQAGIPHPRVGFYGVIDERLDRGLIADIAALRPDLQFVLIGPLAKIDPASLPQAPNLHYLGPKSYEELPAYVAHWEVAAMPFARNAATRFISPTKTPEYLAAGRPVVSTPIADVVRSWGETPYVRIAAEAASFCVEIDRARTLPALWREAADTRLRDMSWDAIWSAMQALIEARLGSARRSRSSRFRYDYLVVGAGFAGAVVAERLAADAGRRVLVIDRRPHIGGNAHDRRDAAGLLVHPYGPHIFHTNSQHVVDYLSRFTAWRPYEHRVLADVGGQLLPMPINRITVNRFFGLDLASEQVGPFLQSMSIAAPQIRNSADVVLAAVGRELYDALFRDYTIKQWGRDASQLDRSVTSRLPVRTDDDDRYFSDRFQAMPAQGYTRMFEAMLDHPNISVSTGVEWAEIDRALYDRIVYTGPVDEFFGCRFGKLPYRSLRFHHETVNCPQVQPVAVINHPNLRVAYTRVTEFKHLTGDVGDRSSLCYEYPAEVGDPYYPIPCPENAALYRRYRDLADATPGVTFVGRLATYQYYNMDQVVGQALAAYDRLEGARRVGAAALGTAAAD